MVSDPPSVDDDEELRLLYYMFSHAPLSVVMFGGEKRQRTHQQNMSQICRHYDLILCIRVEAHDKTSRFHRGAQECDRLQAV